MEPAEMQAHIERLMAMGDAYSLAVTALNAWFERWHGSIEVGARLEACRDWERVVVALRDAMRRLTEGIV